MAEKITSVNPEVLKWARERSGHGIDDVAATLKRDPHEIMAWEAGTDAPTYAQLEKLAYDLYKRPLALFFFPKPPDEPLVANEFRTLPEVEISSLEPNTLYLLRVAKSFQISLRELNDGQNPAERKIFQDINLSSTESVQKQAQMVRDYLEIPLATQIGWQDDDEALRTWRLVIEQAGIFVFKQAFKQKGVSGFCILDSEFPIIFINNTTSKTRQIFSLFHELAHILLHVNGISKFDQSYIELLKPNEKKLEQFCNLFAAELLIPSSDFQQQLKKLTRPNIGNWIEVSAQRYNVSREAILRRLLDKGIVTQDFYEAKAKEWTGQKKRPGGGNYYATQATYLGESYLQLVFGKYYQGKISLEQAAQYFGVKTKSVASLENFALRKAVAE